MNSPSVVSARARQTARGSAHWFSWSCLLLGGVVGIVAPAFARNWGATLLLLSGVAFGMPHGAGDWLLMRARSRTRGQLAWLALIYLALAAAVAALWWWNAAAALWFFLALTAWHWGSGDAHWLERRTAEKRFDAARICFAIGRGTLVMAAPLALHPAQSAQVLREFSALAARGARFPIASALQVAPWMVGGALIFSALAWILRQLRSRPFAKTDFALIVVETLALLILFWATPPLWSVTLYFVALHAWRHILRLEQGNGARLDGAGRIARAVTRFHFEVAPVTALALLGLALMSWLWPPVAQSALALSTAYLILISSLTLPHALAILWLDWRD